MSNIGFAITGSFCTHEKILSSVKELVEEGNNVIPIFSQSVSLTDTRFGTASDLYNNILSITGNRPIETLVDAEPLGPKSLIDLLVIAPCTGNTLAKFANGITDNAVLMVAKSLSRNNKPIIIGVSTNDGLGINLKNIATLLQIKNVYFVPFGQDDCINKPKSLISDWSKINDTIKMAQCGQQLQPLLLK